VHFLNWDGARYFEGGGQNVGLEDIIVHHVEPKAKLGLKLVFDNIQTHFKENFACVLVNTKIKLMRKRARKIHNKGHGTYVLRWVNDTWKVVHTQSTRKRVK
jgi:ketosteroid isomerase-like protein